MPEQLLMQDVGTYLSLDGGVLTLDEGPGERFPAVVRHDPIIAWPFRPWQQPGRWLGPVLPDQEEPLI